MFDPSTPDYDYLPYFYSRIFDLGWQVQLSAKSVGMHMKALTWLSTTIIREPCVMSVEPGKEG